MLQIPRDFEYVAACVVVRDVGCVESELEQPLRIDNSFQDTRFIFRIRSQCSICRNCLPIRRTLIYVKFTQRNTVIKYVIVLKIAISNTLDTLANV